MAEDLSRELKPVAELRRGVTARAIVVLRSHRALRAVVGLLGAMLLLIGVLAAPAWNVPLIQWLTIGQVAGVMLVGGLGMLGLWYVSGREEASRSSEGPTEVAENHDLVGQLERLQRLHATGDLTDEEFRSAKSRLLQ